MYAPPASGPTPRGAAHGPRSLPLWNVVWFKGKLLYALEVMCFPPPPLWIVVWYKVQEAFHVLEASILNYESIATA